MIGCPYVAKSKVGCDRFKTIVRGGSSMLNSKNASKKPL